MFKSILLCLFIFSPFSFADAKSSVREVNAVLTKYRSAEAFRAKVKKTVVQEVMETETVAEGRFYFSKGKLRMEMGEPDFTTLVYDGRVIWMESKIDDERIQVIKVVSRSLKRSDSVLASLFGRASVLESFDLIKEEKSGDMKVYSFKPRRSTKTEVRYLEIALRDKELQRVTYKDDRDNRISIEFDDVVRERIDAAKFAYKPPKGSELTEL